MSWMCRVLVVFFVLPLVSWPPVARAQEAFDETWNLEMSNGPIIAPANVVGMGGAYIGLAEGSGAQAFNPAAVAMRYPYNGSEWFSWDWAMDWVIGGLDTDIDLENDGRGDASGEVERMSFAFNLLFGRFGIGINIQSQNRTSTCAQGATCGYAVATYESTLGGFTAGYNFFDGELVVASEFTLPNVTISTYETAADATSEDFWGRVTMNNGSAFTLGAVWRPTNRPYRVGVTMRRAIPIELDPELTMDPDAVQDGGLVIPGKILVPWQVGVGGVYSIGPRQLNPRTSFGDENLTSQNEESTPVERKFLLVSLDVVMMGATDHAGGVGAWMAGEVARAGEQPTVSVRLGTESEFWPGVMRGRLGTYYEPSRFTATDGRMHWTGGMDVSLFELLWEWRLTLGMDYARDYSNTMLSLGLWH